MLLTRAFVPEDIKALIKGADYASNIYEYIPFRSRSIYPTFLSDFQFGITNSMYGDVEINYLSTIANTYSIFVSLILVIISHIGIWILFLIISKWKESENFIAKRIYKLVEKSFNILTFGYYIRNSLEISQFILISSIYEISEHNTNENLRLISFIFAILMVLWYISILIFSNYLIFSRYELKEEKHNKFGEFFCDLKESK